MKHVLVAVVAVAALAFPGLAATATNTTHGAHATSASPVTRLQRPVHQMLGALPPFIRTGSGIGQGYVLKGRRPRPTAMPVHRFAQDGFPNSDDNLTFGNADQIPPKALASLPRVMNSNTNYAIYWVPSGFRTAANYQPTVDQYFEDVASESGNSFNTDSAGVQYYDSNASVGPVFYDSTFGGSAIDTNPYPKGACAKSLAAINAQADSGNPTIDPYDPTSTPVFHIHVLGAQVCLSDAQLQAEVKKFADSQGWQHGPNTEFFLYTAHNVSSCFQADGQVTYPENGKPAPNVFNQCSYDYYCAYHSSFGTSQSTEYIYANMPWPNQAYSYGAEGTLDPWKKSDCDGFGEHPNGTGSLSNGTDPQGATDADAADEVINVTSHEHNESVTDPTGYGWWVDNTNSPFAGYEDGDLCAWQFLNRSLAGVSGNGSYFTNQLGSDEYFLQGEWSNADATTGPNSGDSGCVWGHDINTPDDPGTGLAITNSGDPVTPLPGDTLTAASSDFPAGTVVEFEWVRCDPGAIIFDSHALKVAAMHHFAKGYAGPTCNLVQDDLSGNSASPSDTYSVTAKDAHEGVVAIELGWNGTEPDFQMSSITVGGEPIVSADPFLTPSDVSTSVPGAKITADLGTWNVPNGSPVTGYSVQWQRCQPGLLNTCKTFKTASVPPAKTGDTMATYTLANADVNMALNVVVTAKNKLGTSDPDSSGLTNAVGGAPTPGQNDSAPFFTDAPEVVGTLQTANFGTWTSTGTPITGYTVTWKSCEVGDGEVADLTQCEVDATQSFKTAATSATYTPVQTDDQNFLVAFITATNKYGSSVPYPAVEGIVGGHPTLDPNGTGPTVTGDGTAGDDQTLNFGDWLGNPDDYRIVEYACTDQTDTSTCVQIGGADRPFAPDTSETFNAPDLSAYGIDPYYLRFNIMAVNSAGFSDPEWSDAELITTTT